MSLVASGLILKLIRAVLVMLSIASLAMLMKRRKLLSEEHIPIITAITVDLVLPFFLFSAMAKSTFDWDKALLPLILIIGELVCFVLAWVAARMLGLTAKQKGAFLLASTFGSTSFLGLPIIHQVLGENKAALADAIISHEFGMSMLLVTGGVAIAMHYGDHKEERSLQSIKKFFRSPIFVSLAAGMAWSIFGLPQTGWFPEFLFGLCHTISGGLSLLAGLCLGLMMRNVNWRHILKVLPIVAAIKLIVQPTVVGLSAKGLNLDLVAIQVLAIMSSMPAATFAAVLSERYGCDGNLATNLVLGTLVVSMITAPVALWIIL